MALPLLITDDEHIPIYLQIAHQVHYLITSRQLEAGAQLPSVRVLAEQLGVNVGTVAQAYRFLQAEGLISSKRGKGTFVVALGDEAHRYSLRQALLSEAVDTFINRAFALGFDATTIRQQLSLQLQQSVRAVPMVLVGPTADTASKYAALVSQALPDVILGTITPCSIETLEANESWVASAYAHAYFTVTFASLTPRVEAALRRHGIQSEIISLTAKLVDDTVHKLQGLSAQHRAALATESRNVNSALAIIAQHSSLDLRSITILTELSRDAEWYRATHEKRLFIHTFGASKLLDAHHIPKEQRLELAFTLSDDTYKELHRLFRTHASTES